MEIRSVNIKDTKELIALWDACGLLRAWNDPGKDIQRKLALQPELFLVGISQNKIVASVMAGYDGHRGSVYYLAVAPEYQQEGLGRLLMEKIEELLNAQGCPKINIMIRTSNVQVQNFYERLGYVKEERVILGKRLIADESD